MSKQQNREMMINRLDAIIDKMKCTCGMSLMLSTCSPIEVSGQDTNLFLDTPCDFDLDKLQFKYLCHCLCCGKGGAPLMDSRDEAWKAWGEWMAKEYFDLDGNIKQPTAKQQYDLQTELPTNE